MSKWVTVEHVREVCFEVARSWPWHGQEPIPPFNTRYPGKLEACLAAPQQTFAGALLYPTLTDQAAILFYLLNKDHPFLNGNKRIAFTVLLLFLYFNDKYIDVPDLEYLYNFA